MKNRYGNEYYFEAVDANTFTIRGELSYWRFGGREGQPEMDFNDLGFVDPSGGPYIGLGYMIEGRRVINIRSSGEDIFFQVESA